MSWNPWQGIFLSFTDTTGNYNNKTGTVTDTINKANAVVTVFGYRGVYNGLPQGATGKVTGVNLAGQAVGNTLDLGAKFTIVPGGTAYWTFNGGQNYNNQSGSVAIIIDKANPVLSVIPYYVPYDGLAHTATGTAKGVGGVLLSGLNLSGTTHTNPGTYNDIVTFTDSTGNYNNITATVTDVITKSTASAFINALRVSSLVAPSVQPSTASLGTALQSKAIGTTSDHPRPRHRLRLRRHLAGVSLFGDALRPLRAASVQGGDARAKQVVTSPAAIPGGPLAHTSLRKTGR